MAPLVRTGGSRHTGLAALPHRNIQISNIAKIRKVLYVNQQPIGKTPRSTVISYLGIYDNIRQLFANTEDAKKTGLSSSDFSMNISGEDVRVAKELERKKLN